MTLRFLDITILIDSINRQIDVNFKQVMLRVGKAAHQMVLMMEKSKQRHQLKGLSDDRLNDLGISRAQANVEIQKFFWE